MGPILVFGHRNPDNDSICSAVAYAHLKNLTDPDNVYLPARLGPVPVETRLVFERFGVALPDEISHVRTRVRDVMTENPVTVNATDTMLDAGREMGEHSIRNLPVLGEGGKLAGLVDQRILAMRYLAETELLAFSDVPVTVAQIAHAVEGDVLVGSATTPVSGDVHIGADEPGTVAGTVHPGDVLIVGDRVRTQPQAIEAGIACLVVAGSAPSADVLALAGQRGTAVVHTERSVYAAVRLVGLAHAVGEFMDPEPFAVSPDALLSEVADDLLGGVHRSAVAVDEAGSPVGILTRTDLARGVRRRVVLVDHNEAAQSAIGVEDAAVVEIVDHHRIGDIQTSGPILFLNLPVGSTATIVATRYKMLGVAVPKPMAGVLLSAVLTDTVLLKSPTTSAVDREVVAELAAIVGVEPIEFGMEVFRSRSAGIEFSASAVVSTDIKEYRVGDASTAIGQYETVDLTELMSHAAEVTAALEARRAGGGYDLVVLMATDIVREGSEVFAVGNTRLAEKALGVSFAEGPVWMPGVLSRKKQVAAKLVEAAGV